MPTPIQNIAEDLLGRFRRQKPLRGGSLIVTIFGDSLIPRGGAIALGSLIRLSAPFGLNERLVRTASTRLAKDGWLETQRVGKLSEYRLSQQGQARFREATERIYAEPTAPWSGRWTLLILPGMKSAEREKIRKELAWHGFGEISQGVFAHPEPRVGTADIEHSVSRLPRQALSFVAELTSQAKLQDLVRWGWDLADLGNRYHRFVRRFESAQIASRVGSAEPRAAFIVRTLLIHEYRRLHLKDPLLPERLLPADWPGTRAAKLCKDLYVRLFEPSEQYLTEQVTLINGPLPPSEPSVFRRFGGLNMVMQPNLGAIAVTR